MDFVLATSLGSYEKATAIPSCCISLLIFTLAILLHLHPSVFQPMSDNIPSVSEVHRRGIWAECRRHEARYTLLGDDGQPIFKPAACSVMMPVSSVIVFINFSYNKIYFS